MGLLTVALLAVALWGVGAEYTDPHCDGKQVMVHLFEWKWTDIALECERFLSKKGYCGVQVSPPNEHVVLSQPPPYPWWQRYQPVSYKLVSRSGNEQEFKDMVQRCKAVGVRIFVDAVVNHMAGMGRKGIGSAGSSYDSDKRDFPGVPYSWDDFHQPDCPVNNYGDPNNVRNCYLVALTDLDGSKEHVRQAVAGYFNNLIDIGVAGFRIDASKHMWPADLRAIQGRLKDVDGKGKPFFVHEVIDQNDGAIKTSEYTDLGWVTEFRFCQKIAWGARDFGQLNNVVDYGWGMTPSDHAFVFADNHDNQRGHGGGGNTVTHKTPRDYKMAIAFMLAYNYGFTRVMSSYYFGDNSDQGPPHNDDYSTKDVTINADGTCGNGWVCEHRWAPIANMAAFRNAVAGTDLNHWYNQNDVVAFARGNKGFFVMAKQGSLDQTFQTGLPAGTYCDIIHDCQEKITVDGSGNARVRITNQEEPIAAFIAGGPSGPGNGNGGGDHGNLHPTNAPTGGPTGAPTDAPTTLTPGPTVSFGPGEFKRTVIFVERVTSPGQDVFLRGGIDHAHRAGCTGDASSSPCAIPIRHNPLGSDAHFDKVTAWSKGDNFLDWYGAETGQGSYHGNRADGTPAVWTTNQIGKAGHIELNTFGEHYWMVDLEMDCSRTENGFFEVKAVVNGQWEGDVRTATSCTGSGAGDPPYASSNHWGRCGFLNVFHFSSASCSIEPIS